MNIKFEPDYQQKVLFQTFQEPAVISSPADVLAWRQSWMGALSSWHSPYKTLIDGRQLTVKADDPEIAATFQRMQRMLSGLFLKKAVAFGIQGAAEILPFPVFASEEEARTELGLRGPRVAADPTDFRSLIQLQNHFQQHVMELSFAAPVSLDSLEQLAVLRSKISNNLMQWHSKWSLLIDCANLAMNEAIHPEFAKLETFLKGFFLKQILGYSPRVPKENYPFTVYRARHNAAGRLESEGNFSGDAADCVSRK